MRKLFLVLLFGLFFAATNYSKAETAAEFRTRCTASNGELIELVLHYPKPDHTICSALILVCASKDLTGNYVTLNYGPITTDYGCNMLTPENLNDPLFWQSVDDQVLHWVSQHGYNSGPCNPTNGGVPAITYFQISKRICQKMVYDSFTYITSLETCIGLEASCVKMFSVCTDQNGNPVATTISTTLVGVPGCLMNSSPQMHPTNISNIFESDCFAVPCN
ncbi:MAG: hypothetical protein NTW25_14100 [Candidatus Kapabacteria bacterium]|nr:hypothetical protein [Candidatus Kapabacteria bacterium]